MTDINVIYTKMHPAAGGAACLAAEDPPAYRQRFETMRSATARQRSRVGLWLLRRQLERAGIDPASCQRIGFEAGGRPAIADTPPFSIAHSDDLVACVFGGDLPLGLDVEARRALAPKHMQRLVGRAESAIIADDPARFFDFWCAREAVVKASGRAGLARIKAVELDGDRARLDGRDWSLRPLSLAAGYAACLACATPIGSITIDDLSDDLSRDLA